MGEPNNIQSVRLDLEGLGVRDQRFDGKVHHYRGIPYAHISERFAKPKLATNWHENAPTFTEYGALCPQPAFPGLEALLSLPTSGEEPAAIEQNEFTCCNLNVTCPVKATGSRWPVFIWIPGGGQSTLWPTAQHRLGDTGPLVAQSVEVNKPIILVTISYRVNLFGFGDPEGVNVNLDLQDQATAMQWVLNYIGLFGGDPVSTFN